MYQAGTLSGNPLATAAGLAVLDQLDPASYAALVGAGGPLRGGAPGRAVRGPGQGGDRRTPTAVRSRPGCRWSARSSACSSCPPGPDRSATTTGAAASAATGLYPRLFRSMLARGVALAPGPYEVAFPSMAHGEAEFDHTLEAASEAIVDALAG